MNDDKFIMVIDQGTTSSRGMLFNHVVEIIGLKQQEHGQFYQKSGWVGHDPLEIWSAVQFVTQAMVNEHDLTTEDLAAIRITNQRETTPVWNHERGKPYYPAIVWQDNCTDIDALKRNYQEGKCC